MSVNDAIHAVLIAINVWWVVKIGIGLVQPAHQKRPHSGTWVQREKRGE